MKGNKRGNKKLLTIVVAFFMVLSVVTGTFVALNNNSKANVTQESMVVTDSEFQDINNPENVENNDDTFRDIELSENDKEVYSDLTPEEAVKEAEIEEIYEVEDEVMPQEEGNFVNPKDVKFMQSSIKNKTGEYTVLGNAEALKNGTLKVTDLALIRLWKDENGQLWTLDHRRLAAFRLAGLESVPFQWATDKEVANQMWKMTTKTNGDTIRLKLGNGENMTIQ